MKQLLVSIAIVFASVLTATGQNHSFSLSGKWDFQIDREDAGIKEQWFNKSLDESINLPGSMPEKLKGDNVTARTQWTGSLYDSSYYFNPYMEKYRIEGQVKLPFFLTPDKHYVGASRAGSLSGLTTGLKRSMSVRIHIASPTRHRATGTES